MGEKESLEKRITSAEKPEELFDAALDAQAAFAEGKLTWQEEQNLTLRAMLGVYEERRPTSK